MKRSEALAALNKIAEVLDIDGELTIDEEALIYSTLIVIAGWTGEEWEAALNGVRMVQCTKAIRNIRLGDAT